MLCCGELVRIGTCPLKIKNKNRGHLALHSIAYKTGKGPSICTYNQIQLPIAKFMFLQGDIKIFLI